MDRLQADIEELKESVESIRASTQFIRDMIIFVSAYLVLREIIGLIDLPPIYVFWGFVTIVLYPLTFWAVQVWSIRRREAYMWDDDIRAS